MGGAHGRDGRPDAAAAARLTGGSNPLVRRVLIWRQGSLGDTIVALPSFHLIARAFPNAERRLLTNTESRAGIAPAVEILASAGLVDGTIGYPERTRSARALAGVAREVRAWRPDVAIYLVEARSRRQHLRDLAFLRLLGIPRVVGTALDGSLSEYKVVAPDSLRESEAARLLRGLRPLGTIDIEADAAWDLRLTGKERQAATAALAPIADASGFVALSIGTKVPVNDYGDANWSAVIGALGAAAPGVALVGLGNPGEAERTRGLLHSWPGPTLNLCGPLHVRESAAVLERASCFLGHDSGPMHLASAVGTPCVAVFSGRNAPGIWFPRGRDNRIFYDRTSCSPCGLVDCVKEGKRCILAIDPLAVAAAGAELVRRDAVRTAGPRVRAGAL